MNRTHRFSLRSHRRVPRPLHPVAWWIWAVGLASTAGRTTNPIVLLLVLAVLGVVVANRRSEAPWARAFKYYLFLALTVITIRVVFRSVFGGDIGPSGMHVLFSLPHIPLPAWAAGIQLGGPVTLEGTLSALFGGLQLGTLLCCLGAANVLANPKRALRVLPGALYELGVAVVVALSMAPQLVDSVQRVRRARKLRGSEANRRRWLRSIAIPVLEDALERSLRLAAAMDSRGYGRTGAASLADRRVTGACMLGGMGGLCVGAYGLLDSSTGASVGFPALAAGALLCAVGLVVGSRRIRRTQYRPDPWRLPEWLVSLSGLLPAGAFFVGAGISARGLNPSAVPLEWPTVPLVAVVVVLLAASPALIAPPPVRSVATGRARAPASASGRDSGSGSAAELGPAPSGERTDAPAAPRAGGVGAARAVP
ncbi:MAG: energy-coupling factor transporter transmembrane component T [Acidimicrobiales bacterium]